MKLLNGLTVGGEPASVGFQVFNTTMEDMEGMNVPAALNVIMNSVMSDAGYVTLTEEEFESKFFKREGFVSGAYVFGDETMSINADVYKDSFLTTMMQQMEGIPIEVYFIKPIDFYMSMMIMQMGGMLGEELMELASMGGIPAAYIGGSWMIGLGLFQMLG